MQFFLKRTNCEELEKECIEYAKKQNAMYFYEKPPGNTHVLYIKLIGLHLKTCMIVIAYLFRIRFGMNKILKFSLTIIQDDNVHVSYCHNLIKPMSKYFIADQRKF